MPILLIGLAITFSLWERHKEAVLQDAEQEFSAAADMVRQSIQDEFSLYMDVLNALANLHTLSDRVSYDAFREMDKGMQFQVRILSSFGFVQLIPLSIRPLVEQQGEASLSIVEWNQAGDVVPAGVRPNYFPVTHQNPPESLGLPNGFDLGSLPRFLQAYQQAAITPRPILFEAPRRDGDPSPRLFVLIPIHEEERGPAPVTGFVIGRLQPSDVIGRATARLPRSQVDVSLVGEPPDRQTDSGGIVRDGERFVIELPIRIADREWTAVCSAPVRSMTGAADGTGILI